MEGTCLFGVLLCCCHTCPRQVHFLVGLIADFSRNQARLWAWAHLHRHGMRHCPAELQQLGYTLAWASSKAGHGAEIHGLVELAQLCDLLQK